MITVGIDIGKENHAYAILDENGRRIIKTKLCTNDVDGATKLIADISSAAPKENIIIGMESTGSYWQAFFQYLQRAGYTVDVINPITSSASMAGDIRGRKSDKQDAEKIAALLLSGNYVPNYRGELIEQKVRALTRQHSVIKQDISRFKTLLKSHLDRVFPSLCKFLEEKQETLRTALLEKYPSSGAMAKARKDAVAKIVKAHTRGKDAAAMAEGLIALARKDIALKIAEREELEASVQSTLRVIKFQEEEAARLEAMIEETEAGESAKIMMQIKGTGKILPKAVAAEFGSLERFVVDPKTGLREGMHKRMLAFAGCEPRVRESGKWKGEIHISKRGSGYLRDSLYKIAHGVSTHDPFFRSVYKHHTETLHKHHRKALFCVICKFLEVVCSLYLSKRKYTVEQPPRKVINSPQNPPEK